MRTDPRRRVVRLGLLVGAALIAVALARPAAAQSPAGPPAAPSPTPEPYARANRLAVSFGFGLGSAAMGRQHDFAADATALLKRSNPALVIDGELGSSFQINAEFSVRYYFPFYVLAQVGYGAIYNWDSVPLTLGPITTAAEYHNVVMDVPILVGGYYTFIDRLYVYGAVGPDIFFFSRSYWDAEKTTGLPDFKADSGAGFLGLVGADFMVASTFAVGLEVRYRYLNSKRMVEIDHNVDPAALGFGSGQPYDLDYSGVSVGLYLRIFPM